MPPLEFFLITFVCAVFAGVLGAMLGLGGGVIMVPVLTLALGVDIRYAIGASIVSVIATSSGAAATYVRDRITNLRIGMFLEMATTTGAISGAYVGGLISGRALYIIFGAILAYSGFMMFRKRNQEIPTDVPDSKLATSLRMHGQYYDAALKQNVHYRVTGVVPALGLMYIAGVVSGLLGIGSGALKVPAMDLAMHLPMKVSSATSNFMIGVTAAASAGIYFERGDIQALIAAPVAMGVLIGATSGTRLLIGLRGSVIRQIFVVVLVVICVEMLGKGLGIQFP
ncbi:MAG: sulfite exporter TauE/SafE family protein [Chloroflexota bacterium]